MTVTLRIVLICVSLITLIYMFRKIRKAQFSIADTLYWIMFAFLLLVMSIFPGVAYFFSDLLGFDSPSNFVFVAVIFLMLMKIFLMSVKISSLENKIVTLVQKYALDEKNDK